VSQPALSDARTSLLGRKETLLSVRDLRAVFDTDDGVVHAVDGVSFDIDRGEVFSVVGESGSGKSVTAMTIMGLLPTVRVEEGEILWKGRDLLTLNEDERRAVRGKEIAMIFQDPLTSLNPVHPVGRQIGEMARIHEGLNRSQAFERSVEMLDLVGIPEPRKRAKMYPHEFSGGMRQRAMIAMAITCKPDLLIADEPTTALDVTVQAQVLEVLIGIKDEIDSAIMLITHDLGVVAGLADRVMVMYAGRQAEMGVTNEIFYETRHPYTLGLLASLPRLDDVGDEPLVPIVGAPPSLIRRPTGCAFHPRCRFSRVPGPCDADVPAFRLVGGDQHLASCHYSEELVDISVESLRERVDVSADAELADLITLEAIEAGEHVQVIGGLAADRDAPPAPGSVAEPGGAEASTAGETAVGVTEGPEADQAEEASEGEGAAGGTTAGGSGGDDDGEAADGGEARS
jgi:oligopeptide transport system ATP-binding protein